MIEPDIHHPQNGNALYVFALPDRNERKSISRIPKSKNSSVEAARR
jgi:hypothetical protein